MEPRALRPRRLTLSNYLLGVVGAVLLGSCGEGAVPPPNAEPGAQAPRIAAPSRASSPPSAPAFRQNLPTAYSQGTPAGSGSGSALPPLSGTAGTNAQATYSGCIAIHQTAVERSCMVGPDSSLVLWIPQTSCQALQVTDGGRPLNEIARATEEGCQFRIKVPASPESVTTLVVTDSQSQQPRLSLVLDRSKPDLLARLKQVRGAATDDDLARLVENLERTLCPQTDAECQMDRARALARSYFKQGRTEEARRSFFDAAEYGLLAGYPSVAVEAEQEIAFLYQEAGKFAFAEDSVKRAQGHATPGYGKQLVQLAYYRAGLLQQEGYFLEALQHFRDCSTYARRLSEVAMLRSIVPLTTDLAVALGRFDDAAQSLKLFPQLLEGASVCQRALLLENQGWIINGLVEAGLTEQTAHSIEPMDAVQIFRKAKTAFDACPNNPYLAHLYLGWVHALLVAGSLADAKIYLGKAQGVPGSDPETTLGLLHIEARIALKEQRFEDSLRLYRKLDSELKQNPSFQMLRGGLFVCNQVIGASISYQALRRQNEVVSLVDQVQRCIDPEQSRLLPTDRRALCVHAKEGGLPVQAGACSR